MIQIVSGGILQVKVERAYRFDDGPLRQFTVVILVTDDIATGANNSNTDSPVLVQFLDFESD